ncbi:something about silencing protein 10 isoform X2 [Medicago truncatula]|uniref:Sas10/U3 ribonucleoprotein (UTP) family protein, putative n=1 Tax=Medicago truncatula TaxID=3880 RepID=A0A072UMN4_MEDTR|nr:something about silencing protein 10 isoform X2 [Medicago truncatula]KEH30922.1 Sas10/U3 ribonucleoprotein (UTP) family protein, putative [Medicago truncatula]
MAKKGGGSKSYQKKKDATTTSRRDRYNFSAEDMDDEIDIFHKQRDIVPLDINADSAESDEDDEMPIFNDKDIDNDETDEDGDEEEDDDDEDDEYDGKEKGFIGQLIRQQKYLKSLHGGDEDGMQDEEDDEGIKKTIVGRKHRHGADNRNFELQSSDDEALKEEEEIAREEQREKAKLLTEEDFDLVEDEDNEKLTFKDASDNVTSNVEDLSALSKEEQMNVLYRSAPELVDWLSELNEAHKQLEFKINPFLSKVKKGEIVMEGGVRYFELKQLILLSYCQAITFYLLLKSEGQSVDHHPVIGRLEEIKELMNQTKQLDSELPVELEDILKASSVFATVVKSDNENAPMPTDSIAISEEQPLVSAESPEEAVVVITKDGAKKGRKVKDQDHIGVQSSEMLKVRASLEEKLKQKGLYSQIAPKPSNSQKRSRPANGQLATYDDFDDAVVVNGPAGLSNGLVSSKVSPFVNANLKKLKVASGDDDLPKRDAIGERRERHEKRVMAGAGVTIEDDNDDDDQMDDLVSHEVGEEDIESGGDSENEFYKQVEKLQAAKRAAKAVTYSTSSRKSAVPSLPEETADGKRYITSQMSKNRGLTRSRNKDKKNPRKNYKLKHQKAVKNRKGQVQSIRRPNAPYSGESTGINATISRSIRFRS